MGNNKAFLNRLMANDPAAQREMIDKYNSRLFLYFRMRIKGEESYGDLVQEVFASFFENVGKDKIISDEYIAPFLFGIAKRVVYNFFYQQKRTSNIHQRASETFDTSVDFQQSERLENEGLTGLIQASIAKLPEIDRVILREFFIKENSIGDVAETVGKSRHYVSVRKERALKKIKSEMKKNRQLYNR